MDFGEIVGFVGRPVGHGPQLPAGYSRGMEELDRSSLLPNLLWGSHTLISYEPGRGSVGLDPYFLYDRWGSILFEWPVDYEPNWIDVREVCQELNLI